MAEQIPPGTPKRRAAARARPSNARGVIITIVAVLVGYAVLSFGIGLMGNPKFEQGPIFGAYHAIKGYSFGGGTGGFIRESFRGKRRLFEGGRAALWLGLTGYLALLLVQGRTYRYRSRFVRESELPKGLRSRPKADEASS